MITRGKNLMIAMIVFLSIGFILELVLGITAGRIIMTLIAAFLLYAVMRGETWARYTLAVLLAIPLALVLLLVIATALFFGGASSGTSAANASIQWGFLLGIAINIGNALCAYGLFANKDIQAYMANARKKTSRKRRKK